MSRRRARLIVNCGGDREQVRGVERLLDLAALIARARRREKRRQQKFEAA